MLPPLTCTPKSAQNGVRFSYSEGERTDVEEQAYGGADVHCAEAVRAGPEGGGCGP